MLHAHIWVLASNLFLKKYACIWPIIYLAVSKLIIKEPLGVEGSDFGEKTEYR